MSNQNIVRFNNTNRQFYTELKKRVDGYFRENNISKTGNTNMYIKTVFMFTAYFVPYFLITLKVFIGNINGVCNGRNWFMCYA